MLRLRLWYRNHGFMDATVDTVVAETGRARVEVRFLISEGQPTRVRALVARAKSAEAHCRTANPTGESCIGEVQRYYMRLWQGGGG